MGDTSVNNSGVLDRSVIASLRELQDEGDPDIVEEVGGLFIKHGPEKISAIKKAAAGGDAKGLQVAAHSLKSSSAYVGAMRLSAMSKELEFMGREDRLEGAFEKAALVEEEFNRVRAALEEEMKSGEQSTKKC